jgi:hypothetical protein
VANVDTGPMNADLKAPVVAEEVALLPGINAGIVEETEAGDTLANTKIEVDRAVIRVIIAIISEATGTALGKYFSGLIGLCVDLPDAITIDNLVIVTRETELTAGTSETTEEEIEAVREEKEENKDAAEVQLKGLDLLVPEGPMTEGAPKMMGVPLNSNKVSVSTATKRGISGITAPSMVAKEMAPEKEVWTEGEIIEIIVPEEEEITEAAEEETAEATLLGNSPGADLPAPHIKPEEATTPERPGKAMGARNKVITTVNPKAGEGITGLNRDLDRPEEDATSTKAITEKNEECDD